MIIELALAGAIAFTGTPTTDTTIDRDGFIPSSITYAPPCAEEDAWPQAICRWDADTAGLANGGNSFTAVRLTDTGDEDTYLFWYDNGTWETLP